MKLKLNPSAVLWGAMLLGGGGGRSLGVLAEAYTDLPNGKLSSYIASHFKTKIVSVVHT